MYRRSVEARAKTVDKAISKALAELGVTRDEVEIEILNPGSRGLLGLGAEDAVVRVSITAEPTASERDVEAVGEETRERELVTEVAVGVLRRLLREMGIQADVVVEPSESQASDAESPLVLNVTGKDLGVLIGRRGETLRDLQFLTRLIVSRRTGNWPNLVVDVDHYRKRRQRALTQLAQRMAERVVKTHQPVPLEPMPAYERRIVHLALRDHPHVRTESTGEGDRRKVVIWPKD